MTQATDSIKSRINESMFNQPMDVYHPKIIPQLMTKFQFESQT